MKICMLTTSYPRWKGDPSGPFIEELCKELVKRGIDVNVVAPHDINTKNFEIIDGIKVHRFRYWFTKKGARLAYGGGMPYNFFHFFQAKIQLLFFIPLFFFKGIKIAKKCDIIHSQFLLSGFVGVFINNITRKKLILTVHAGGLFGLQKIPFKKKIANLIANKTNSLQFVSNYIKERFVELLSEDICKKIGNNIIVMPMGVNVNRFNLPLSSRDLPKETNDRGKLLFVGRISDKKGLPTLIDSVNILKDNSNNFKLYIVGEGPLKIKMEEKTRNFELNQYIEFTGRLSDDELTKFYLSSDIVIVPSIISKYGNTEGLPVVILEAMAAGKPVIASNVSGIPEIVIDGKTGFLVQPKDKNQLAKKIQYLLSNPTAREKMGNYGRNIIIRNYTWEKIALKTIELYKKNS